MRPCGIDPDDARGPHRDVASAIVANEFLGLDLIAPAYLATLSGKLGSITSFAPGNPVITNSIRIEIDSQLAAYLRNNDQVLQEWAKAASFGSVRLEDDSPAIKLSLLSEVLVPFDDGDGETRCELTNLQWLDSIIGQPDRHAENIMYGRGPAGDLKISAIDNDLAFGASITDPEDLTQDYLHGAHLPQVISKALYDPIMGLDTEAVGQRVTGLLNSEEIEAQTKRIEVIKKHLSTFANDQILGSHEDWNGTRVAGLLGIPDFKGIESPAAREVAIEKAQRASYVARDAGRVQGAMLKGMRVVNPDEIRTKLAELAKG